MPRVLKSGQFWAGVIVGVFVGPWAMGKIGGMGKAKLPASSS